jgi:CHAD domain-containing protein
MAVIELACKRIFKRYRRVIRDGEAILTDETVVENKMHALRIDCKKLRYLLEFFASLFPRDEIDLLVKQLKKLQDNLGDFNDFVVQGEYLIQILKDLSLEGEQARMALASIGGLVGHLDEEKARVQGEFAQTFRAFAAKENQKRFQKLFKDDNGGAK